MPNPKIIIELIGSGVKVQCPKDAILTFGMMRMADIQIVNMLTSPNTEEESKILKLPVGTKLR